MGEEKRLVRALRGEKLAHPPFWFMRQAGRYLPEYRDLRAKAGSFLELCYNPDFATEVSLQPIRRYGMDGAILFADILLIPDGLGQPLAYKEGEGPRLEPVRDRAALAKLDPGRVNEHVAPVFETVRQLARALPEQVTLIGFAGAPWTVATYMVEGGSSRDFAHVKGWAFADPDGFQVLIDMLVEATVAYLAEQVRAGAEVVQLFDTWAGVLPEPAFERWCIAPTAAIVAALRAEFPALPIIGFPRGVGAGYAAYAAATGVDGLSLDPSVPIEWARDVLGPRVALQGNLDPHWLVVGGKGMEEAARRLLDGWGQGADESGAGGYIFNLGHGIVPQTPPEHVAALCALLRGE